MTSLPIGTKGVPRAERESQIVTVAVTEFAARGYAGASMVDIAAEAGISKPLIYQYFGSKDGLFLICLNHVGDGLLSRLEAAETSVDDTVLSRIHALRAIFTALEPQPGAWRLLFDASLPRDGSVADAASGFRRRLTRLAAGGSERFLRARGITSADDASALTAIWMGVVNSAVTWWLDHPQESADAMIERSYRLLAAIAT